MRKAKKQQEPNWLDPILDELKAKKERGESPSLAYLLEELLNELMKRERQRYLEQHPTSRSWVIPRKCASTSTPPTR